MPRSAGRGSWALEEEAQGYGEDLGKQGHPSPAEGAVTSQLQAFLLCDSMGSVLCGLREEKLKNQTWVQRSSFNIAV